MRQWLQENKWSEEKEKGVELANLKGLFFSKLLKLYEAYYLAAKFKNRTRDGRRQPAWLDNAAPGYSRLINKLQLQVCYLTMGTVWEVPHQHPYNAGSCESTQLPTRT